MSDKFPYKKTVMDSLKDGAIIGGTVGTGAFSIKIFFKKTKSY